MGRKKSNAPVAQANYYVYIGPTIWSAIQRNSIFVGSFSEVTQKLAMAIEKYPPIAQLLVSGDELSEARRMIKQPGNRLYEVYRRFINGLS